MKKRLWPVRLTACFLVIALLAGAKIASAGQLPVKVNPGQDIINPGISIPVKSIFIAPSNLKAVFAIPGKVTLTWTDNSATETGFMIERRTESGAYLHVGFAAANATSYEESELSIYPVFPGEKYYYRVKAFNDSNGSGYSNEAFVTVKKNTPPAPPTMFEAEIMVSVGNHPVKLTWIDNSDDETKFVVQRQKEGYGFEIIKDLPPDTTEYEDKSTLQKDVKYTYRIEVFNMSGSAYSNYASVVYPSYAPSTPQYFTAVAMGPTSIRLSWTDTSDNEDGFWIGRKKTYSGSYPPSTNPDFDLGPNVTEVLDTGLEPDTEYSYIIAAHNALYSSFVAETKTTTGPKPPVLTATAVSSGEIGLTWINQSGNVDTYEIERKKEGDSYVNLVTLSHPGELAYSDKSVSPGTKYYYRIKAWRVFYPSDYSQEVSATTPPLSLQPGQFSVVPQISSSPSPDVSAGKTTIRLNLDQTVYRINNEKRRMDTVPVSYEGRIMLPIRYVTEPLGAKIAWDAASQKVTVTLGDKVIELWIGKNTAMVNGREVMIDPENSRVMPVMIPPGRIMLPVRFISENLDCQVEWDPASREARLIY